MSEEKEKRKEVFSIRGLDPELYDRFSRKASELRISVGELMNQAMRTMLSIIEVGASAGKLLGESIGRAGATVAKAPLEIMKPLIKKPVEAEVITGVTELSVSRRDLEAIKKPVVFTNICKLEFEDDVTLDVFEEKVESIKLVDELVLPKHIPKLLAARKCYMVKRIVYRE